MKKADAKKLVKELFGDDYDIVHGLLDWRLGDESMVKWNTYAVVKGDKIVCIGSSWEYAIKNAKKKMGVKCEK